MITRDTEISKEITPEMYHSSDWLLRLYVNGCNHGKSQVPITLHVKGVLISGILVGGEQYFNGVADDAKKFGGDDDLEVLYRKFADVYTKEKNVEPEPDTEYLPQYIHLKKARFIHPSGGEIPETEGAWWRGRLEEVDGFVIGMLTAF